MREDLVGSVLENLLRGLEGAEALGGEEGSHARHGREPLGPGFDECPLHPRRRLLRVVFSWVSVCVCERECVCVCM